MQRRTRSTPNTLGLSLWLLCAGGCCSHRDVSDQAPYLIGYRPGVTYRLKQEAVLVEGNGVYLMYPDEPLGPGVKVVERVAAGTVFRVDRIVRSDFALAIPVQGEHWVDTLGVIVGGPLDGWVIAVKLGAYEWVRNKPGQAFASLYKPAPDSVEEVEPGEGAVKDPRRGEKE